MAYFKADLRSDSEKRISRALRFIQHNLDTSLSLERLAEISCFSPSHFHRLFTSQVGESVYRHIKRLRMERAAAKLVQSRDNVAKIASSCGYNSVSVFNKAFKAYFKANPSEYRKNPPLVPAIGGRVNDSLMVSEVLRRR